MRRFLLLCAVLSACVQPLHAQLQVGLEIRRHFFMLYEPIVATVTIKNMAGRDVTLADAPAQSWFSFQVNRTDGQLVPPLNPDYQLPSLTIPMGQSIRRSIILNTLYPVRELGAYRIRATVYFAPMDKYFQSQPVNLELSEGRTVWQQTVGIPEGATGAGGTRKISLLSFRQSDFTRLYARVEDVDEGTVYATTPLGKIFAATEPDVQIDCNNTLHVLQVAGPKLYLYSHLGLNGEMLSQEQYASGKARPILSRSAAGIVTVAGGEVQQPDTAAGAAEKAKTVNKLSDRPVQIPKE